jgi:radical SAM protein with 4Fe4S-binding SPASM domain
MENLLKETNHPEPVPLPEVFILELTHRCNNRCLYCYASWDVPGCGRRQEHRDEMSTAEVKEVIAKLQGETPLQSIALSGGEPLLREDIGEISLYLESREIGSLIITNGTLLTPERVSSTMAIGNYEITLLSYRPEVHDRIAGREGAWRSAVEGMANVHQVGGKTVAVFIATRLNYMDLHKTAELAIALGADALMYNRINASAHNMQFVEQIFPTPAMIRDNLDVLEDLGEKYGLTISAGVVIEPCVVDTSKYTHIHFGWCPLAGERSYFTIDPSGNVRICNHSPMILGNIKEQPFAEIYYHHPYVQCFRNTMPQECQSCKPEWKEICRGGCKAAGEQCYGAMGRVDPYVILNRAAVYG